MRTPLKLLLLAPAFLILAAPSHPETACTMDAKLCPDGETYVGRQGPNCEFAPCPQVVNHTMCDPYVCADGTYIDSCDAEGNVLQYFAPPCLTHGGESGAPFEDIPSYHPNAGAIFYVKSQGIVEGYEDGTYRPDATINRAEFVKILVGAYIDRVMEAGPSQGEWENMSCTEPDMHLGFSDTDDKAWYAFSVCTAHRHLLIDGYSDHTFRPGNAINFAESAKILVKAFGLEASSTIPACEGGCPWYRSYVLMLEMKAAIPMSITRFDQNITRGEMAEMIYRLKAGVAEKESGTYEDIRQSSQTFGECGKVSSYANRPWFKDFEAQVSERSFSLNHNGAGCLASDESLFLALTTLGPCAETRMLVYRSEEKSLDTADILWRDTSVCTHMIDSFGEQHGSIIALTGTTENYAARTTHYYEYDLLRNLVVLTKSKKTYFDDTPEPVWTYYND